MVIYRDWTDNGVLHLNYEPFDCWEWITPEFMAAIETGDTKTAKRLAGIE